MSQTTTAPTHRLARSALLALLLTSAAGAALAAPHRHPRAPAAPSATDARLAAMQAQLDEMRAQMNQMSAARQTEADTRLAALQSQLDAANHQIAELTSAQADAAADIVTLKAPPPVSASLPNGKPALASSDGRFTANVRAIVMFDAGKYFQKDGLPAAVTARDLNDGTNFRRARFGIDGKLFKDFDYALIYEFGGSGGEDTGHIQEAWAQYTGLKPWKIRLGAFEPNIGLAAAVSTSQMPLLERPSPAEVARNVAAGDSRSALQIFGNGLWGQGDSGLQNRWFASGAVTGNVVSSFNSLQGSFNSQASGEQTAVIGRLALAPFQSTDWQAHFGVNGQYVTQPNDTGAANANRYPIQLRDRPELRLDGARLVDTGGIDSRHAWVVGGEAAVSVRNFLLEAEAFRYGLDWRITGALNFSDPTFSGWYVQGVWVLTGETRPYNPGEARFDAPKMNYNFNPAAGTWGAFELAARYSDLDLNYHDCGAGKATPTVATAACFDAVRGGEQKVSAIGLNWYLNPSMRLMFDYQHVDVSRFNAAGVQVGQAFNALSARAQFAF